MILTYFREFRKDYYNNTTTESYNETSLGDHLLGFLDFYTNKFYRNGKKIILKNGGSIVDKTRPSNEFSMISPQDDTHDIGHSAYKIRDVFNSFQNRYRFLQHYNFTKRESILKYLINP